MLTLNLWSCKVHKSSQKWKSYKHTFNPQSVCLSLSLMRKHLMSRCYTANIKQCSDNPGSRSQDEDGTMYSWLKRHWQIHNHWTNQWVDTDGMSWHQSPHCSFSVCVWHDRKYLFNIWMCSRKEHWWLTERRTASCSSCSLLSEPAAPFLKKKQKLHHHTELLFTKLVSIPNDAMHQDFFVIYFLLWCVSTRKGGTWFS